MRNFLGLNMHILIGLLPDLSKLIRRGVFFSLVASITSYGIYLMYNILVANGLTPLEMVILLLFAVTFAWIAVAFCSAATGFVIQLIGLCPFSLRKKNPDIYYKTPIGSKTAVIMPVYNENTSRVMAGIEAVYKDLHRTGKGDAFDFFLLSDTNNHGIAAEEEKQFCALKERVEQEDCGLFYRRREHNQGRKAGNISDFCRRWGSRYDYMIVLDADSIMSGDTIIRLVGAMQSAPSAGIIQTVPLPVRQMTFFGRFLQFASALYSPMLSTGMCFWQLDTANYWGHNAIINIKAFMENCGLPDLPGEPPLGGEILSHDFVEAALIRRGGWHTYILPELGGSFEEVPANILDYAKRDRRWVEGNLQHSKLLGAHGLHPLSRLYFLMGMLAYCSSFLWLLMLLVSTVDAAIRALTQPVYFGSSYQLFPNWPVSRSEEMFSLIGIVVIMLILPKVMGVVLCMIDREKRRSFGGALTLITSSVVEVVFAVLVAPIMMCYHAYFVLSVLSGVNVRWEPQNREGLDISWRQATRSALAVTLFSIIWGAVSAVLSPQFFWWLTPVLTGLVLSVPVIAISSRRITVNRLTGKGMFTTPSETYMPEVLSSIDEYAERSILSGRLYQPFGGSQCPPEKHTDMPVQEVHNGPKWSNVHLPEPDWIHQN